MENPDDPDEEKINNYLYELSLATRDFIKDPAFNQAIITLAQKSETDAANLLDLASTAPQFYAAINAKLAVKNLSIQIIADDLTHAPIGSNPAYPETEETERYVPAIFIPNLHRIDVNLQPIISPNIEVDSRDDQSIEDNVIAWFFENANSTTVKEITISESVSLNTSNPLFLLDHAVTTLQTAEDKTATPLITKGSAVAAGSSTGTLSFSSKELKIGTGYRHETGFRNASEFTVQALRIDAQGDHHWIYPAGFLGGVSFKVIDKVETDEIGLTLYRWSHHASDWQPWSNPWTPTVIQNGVNMVFWNTYERDWNRSTKALGTVTASGNTINLSGRMRYTNDWYAWIPSTANVHYTRFNWIYDNWAHWNNSWKSDFRLWRVHI